MLKPPKYEMDNNKIWLRLPLGDNGEVNHFIDALLLKAQMEQDTDLLGFCGHLKAHERFYKNDLVTDFDIKYLGLFLNLLTQFVDVTDPYDMNTVKEATETVKHRSNVVDSQARGYCDIVDTNDTDLDNNQEEGADI